MRINKNARRRQGRTGSNRMGDQSGNRGEGRTRAHAQQMMEKFRNMARDAAQSEDRVLSERYLQKVDHYFRIVSEINAKNEARNAQNQNAAEARREKDKDRGNDKNSDSESATRKQGQEQEGEKTKSAATASTDDDSTTPSRQSDNRAGKQDKGQDSGQKKERSPRRRRNNAQTGHKQADCAEPAASSPKAEKEDTASVSPTEGEANKMSREQIPNFLA